MFGKILLISALTLTAWMFVAHASQGAGPTMRYTVKPGDTLWSIASTHYAGDPRAAIYRIAKRNDIANGVIVPGERLVLPSAR
jgi:LysM repeat protein